MLPILNQSLWRDEAFSALLSIKSPLEIISLSMRDTTPPLHYLLLHYWMLLFGTTEPSLRGLSFLFHALAVFVVFLITRKLMKSVIAQAIIPLCVLLNPFLIQYAFEARAYSLLVFLTVLAVYFAITKRYLLTGLVLSLAVFTHNFTVFNLIAFAAWFFVTHKNTLKTHITDSIKLFILPIVTLLAWGSIIWLQWTKVAGGFWIKPATFSLFLNSFEKYSRGDLSYPVQPLLFTFTLVLCFFAFGYWMLRDQKEEKGNALLLISFLALIPTLITYVISALFSPIYDARYLIAAVPMLIILVGYSLFRLFEINHRLKNLVIAFVAIYVLLLIQASEQIVTSPTKPSINYGVRQVISKARPGDIIISQSVLNFLETTWYAKEYESPIPVFTPPSNNPIPFYIGAVLFDSEHILKSLPKNQRIWIVKPDGGHALLQE